MPFTNVFQKPLKTPPAQGSMRRLGLFGLCFLTGCLVIPGVVIAHEGNIGKVVSPCPGSVS